MKVLIAPAHVLVSTRTGTEASWAYNIIARLVKRFNVHIDAVCGKADGLTLPNSVRIFETGFNKGDLISRGSFYFGCYNIAKKLCKDADVVHHMFPFGFRAGFNPLVVFRHLRDKPFIIGPIQYPQEYTDITDYEWVSGRRGLKARLMYDLEYTAMRFIQKPIEMLHKATLGEAEALVFDSRKTLEQYRKLYPDVLRGKILQVIPPGVETEQFQYVPPIKKDHFEILTVGHLLKRKGIQHLIRAMPIIIRELKNVRLKIVGNGPYKESLVKLTKELHLNNHVELCGHVPRDKLPKVYANCDIYVQPSLSEAFPTVIREAMATGRPVVATRVGCVEEHVKDGINGYLVSPKSSEALARKIIDLLKDEDWRAKMGEEARKYAEENLDWHKLAEAWYEIYNCVI